jgi:hypothetical protein
MARLVPDTPVEPKTATTELGRWYPAAKPKGPRLVPDTPKVGLGQRIKQMDAIDIAKRAPFSLVGIAENVELKLATERLKRDKYPYTLPPPTEHFAPYDMEMAAAGILWGDIKVNKEDDIAYIERFLEKANQDLTIPAKAFEIGSYMPAWIIEFLATGGIAKVGSTAAKQGGARLLKRYAATKAGKAALKGAGFTGSVVTRGMVGMPHRAAEEIVTRRVPGIEKTPEGKIIITDVPEGWGTSIAKGIGSHLIEVASEETGAGINKLLGWGGAKAAKLPFAGKIVTSIGKAWSKLKPQNTPKIFQDLVTKGKFHGVLAELGEERVATVLHAVAKTQDIPGDNVFERIYNGLVNDMQNLPAEALAFGVLGAGRFVGGKLTEPPANYEAWLSAQTIEAGKVPKDIVSKLAKALEEATPIRVEQEAARTVERGVRGGEYESVLKEALEETGDPRQARIMALRTLEGELPTAEFTSLSDKISKQEEDALLISIFQSEKLLPYEKVVLPTALLKMLDKRQLPTPSETKALGKFFGPELAQAIAKKRPLSTKIYYKTLDTLNLPRALLASFDLSAAGRQGILLLPVAPKRWAESLAQGAKAALNERYADFYMNEIETHPNYTLLKKSGIQLTDWKGVGQSLDTTEEKFQTGLAEKIPGVRMSERAYVTTLNILRAKTFYDIVEQWEGTGKTSKDYKALAKFINHATGRGTFKGKKIKPFLPVLNATFFSPRLLLSRFQVVGDLLSKSSAVRKIVAADLVKFVSTGLGVLYMLSMNDEIDVEHDPRSSDFGKIKIGDTRIDFWAGYSQIARYVAQLVTRKRKALVTGRMGKVEVKETLWRFFQSKLNPAIALPVDIIRGETFLGDKMSLDNADVMEQVYQRLTPLFIQDTVDAIRFQGLDSVGYVAPSAFFGLSAQTYPETTNQQLFRLRNHYSQQTFGKKWDEIGDNAQKLLRASRPQIVEYEERVKNERENYDFMGRMIEEQKAKGTEIQDNLPDDIQGELDNIGFAISGMSRYIGNNWYLNDKRYEEYTSTTGKVLNKVIPKLVRSSTWDQMPNSLKREVLDELISMTKQTVRQSIIDKANRDDLFTLQDMLNAKK